MAGWHYKPRNQIKDFNCGFFILLFFFYFLPLRAGEPEYSRSSLPKFLKISSSQKNSQTSKADTLRILLSKPIKWNSSWENIFLVSPLNSSGECDTLNYLPLPFLEYPVFPQIKTSNLGYEYQFLLEANSSIQESCVKINPFGPLSTQNFVSARLLFPVVGGGIREKSSFFIQGSKYGGEAGDKGWIPLEKQGCGLVPKKDLQPWCHSLIEIATARALTIQASIYTQTGESVWWKNWIYTPCRGATENLDLAKKVWIYWPLVDMRGNPVGTGVYIWKIHILDNAKNRETVFFRQGVTGSDKSQLGQCQQNFE